MIKPTINLKQTMKYLNFVFILSMILLSFSGCTGKNPFDLKGNVASIKEETFHASEKFGDIVKGDLIDVVSYMYSKDTNVQITRYDRRGDVISKEETSIRDNKWVSTKSTHEDYESFSVTEPAKMVESESKIVTRDSKHEVSIQYNTDNPSAIDSTFKYFDKNGNICRSIDKYKNGSISKTEYTCDRDGQITSFKWFNADNSLQQWTILKYDDNKFLIKESHKVLYGSKSNKTTIYKYKTDNIGNWIERIGVVDNEVSTITFRTITYH